MFTPPQTFMYPIDSTSFSPSPNFKFLEITLDTCAAQRYVTDLNISIVCSVPLNTTSDLSRYYFHVKSRVARRSDLAIYLTNQCCQWVTSFEVGH